MSVQLTGTEENMRLACNKPSVTLEVAGSSPVGSAIYLPQKAQRTQKREVEH